MLLTPASHNNADPVTAATYALCPPLPGADQRKAVRPAGAGQWASPAMAPGPPPTAVGRWRTGCFELGLLNRDGYEPKANTVVLVNVLPAPNSVDGKFGWFGESGKCCVSNVYA